MSLLYSSSFKYQEGDLMRKNPEFMDLNHHYYNQEQNYQNSGLARYRSAPSSFYDSLVNGNNGQNDGECEDYNILSRFLSECNGSTGDSNSQIMQMKQEIEEPAEIVYANDNGNSRNVKSSDFNVMKSMAMENNINTMQPTKLSSESNIVRQHSSPADFFNNLGVDNGFNITKDANGYRVSNGMNGESNPSSSRLAHNLNFASGQRLLPQIAEIGDESPDSSSPESKGKRHYMNFRNDSWEDSSSNGFKRLRNNDGNVFTNLNILENQNETGLTHHLSLPKTAGEMAHIEKYLEFQNSVPCKIRAKRGFATHPRSIAERVRRSRISQRMKKLQELFPNMDKQTTTADMLDLAVEYIKDLQKQVKTLGDTKAKCSCSGTYKSHASA